MGLGSAYTSSVVTYDMIRTDRALLVSLAVGLVRRVPTCLLVAPRTLFAELWFSRLRFQLSFFKQKQANQHAPLEPCSDGCSPCGTWRCALVTDVSFCTRCGRLGKSRLLMLFSPSWVRCVTTKKLELEVRQRGVWCRWSVLELARCACFG